MRLLYHILAKKSIFTKKKAGAKPARISKKTKSGAKQRALTEVFTRALDDIGAFGSFEPFALQNPIGDLSNRRKMPASLFSDTRLVDNHSKGFSAFHKNIFRPFRVANDRLIRIIHIFPSFGFFCTMCDCVDCICWHKIDYLSIPKKTEIYNKIYCLTCLTKSPKCAIKKCYN